VINLQRLLEDVKNEKALIVDVREEEEWDQEHLTAAKLFPFSHLEEGSIPKEVPLDTPIYLHCRSGHRAKLAVSLLKKAHFTDVHAIEQSFEELKSAHFEII
jgi:rhodanese-related sulfurtransferase